MNEIIGWLMIIVAWAFGIPLTIVLLVSFLLAFWGLMNTCGYHEVTYHSDGKVTSSQPACLRWFLVATAAFFLLVPCIKLHNYAARIKLHKGNWVILEPFPKSNQWQDSPSPSGDFTLRLSIEKNIKNPTYSGIDVWKVTIFDSSGSQVYKDEDSTMVAHLNIYWGWDDTNDHVWVYNSDDCRITRWRFDGQYWLEYETVLNNIHITESQIGVISTGSVQTIDAAVTTIRNGGDPALAEAITKLTEAVISDETLLEEKRKEVLEYLGLISAEASRPELHWRENVIRLFVEDIGIRLQGSAGAITIYDRVHPILLLSPKSEQNAAGHPAAIEPVAAMLPATPAAATPAAPAPVAANVAPSGGGSAAGIDSDVMALGKASYALCAACHGPDGTGLKLGPVFMAPSMVGSEMLLGDPDRLLLVVLKGIAKENMDFMGMKLPLGAVLDDQKLAAVLTYVRNEWGNSAPAVTVEQAAAARAKFADVIAPAGIRRTEIEQILAAHK